MVTPLFCILLTLKGAPYWHLFLALTHHTKVVRLPKSLIPDIPNCSITYGLCSCGTIHAYLSALAPIPPNTPLHVGDPPYHDSDFILQFDGGAFRTLQVGGAGVVLWQHTRGHLTFVDSLCIPLASCPDAAHAEAAAAAGAVSVSRQTLSSPLSNAHCDQRRQQSSHRFHDQYRQIPATRFTAIPTRSSPSTRLSFTSMLLVLYSSRI